MYSILYTSDIMFVDWYRATQAMECLGLICLVLALLIMLLYFCVPSCKVRNVLYGMICFTFLSGNNNIVTVVKEMVSKLHTKTSILPINMI